MDARWLYPHNIVPINRHRISPMYRNRVEKGRNRNRRKSQDEPLPVAGRKKRPRHAQPKLTRKMITGITIEMYAWCLPVNSVSASKSAIIQYSCLLITSPHRRIRHAAIFLINSKQKIKHYSDCVFSTLTTAMSQSHNPTIPQSHNPTIPQSHIPASSLQPPASSLQPPALILSCW